MTQTIITWIHAKLEYILGTTLGSITLVLDIPELLVKCALALILGFLGAVGAGLYKLIEAKLKKKKK